MSFRVRFLLLLVLVSSTPCVQAADECYFGVVEKVHKDSPRIEISLLPTNRKRGFTVMSFPAEFADGGVGKKVIVSLTGVDLPQKRISVVVVNSTEYETALLPLAKYMLDQKQLTLAEEFLAWGVFDGEQLASEREKDPKFSGHMIVGRIACDEKIEFQKWHSQARGFPGGFFQCNIRTPGAKVGICYPGFLPLELATDGPGPVQMVKNLKLVRPLPEQLGGFRVQVKLEGDAPLAESYSVSHVPLPMGNGFWSDRVATPHPPVKTLIQQGSEVSSDPLPPGKYRVTIAPQKPTTLLTHRSKSLEFEIKPGEVKDLGELMLPRATLVPIAFARSTVPRFDARAAEIAYLLPDRVGTSNTIVADPAFIDDRQARKSINWARILEPQPDQLIFQGGRVSLMPLCALGPGPLDLYLDKVLPNAQPLRPINDAIHHGYQGQYDLKLGTVYLYRGINSHWILLQVGGELPKAAVLEQARIKAAAKWQSADYSKTEVKDLPVIAVGKMKKSRLAADELQGFRFRPGQGQLDQGTGLIPLGGTTAATTLGPDFLISRTPDGEYFGVERNPATLLSLSRVGAGPMSNYIDTPRNRDERIEFEFALAGSQPGTRQVPLESGVVYSYRGVLFELDSQDKTVVTTIAATRSLNLELPAGLAIYATSGNKLVQFDAKGQALAEKEFPHAIGGIAFARDGLLLAIPNGGTLMQGQPSSGGRVELLDWTGKTTAIPLPAEVKHPASVAAIPALNHFVVTDHVARNAWFLPGGEAASANKLFNWDKLEKTRQAFVEEPDVTEVILLPSGKAFASVNNRGGIQPIDLKNVNSPSEKTMFQWGQRIAAWKEDDVWAMRGGNSGVIDFYRGTKATGKLKLPAGQQRVLDMEFLDADTLLIVLDVDRPPIDPFGAPSAPATAPPPAVKLWYARLSALSIEPAFEFTTRNVSSIAVGKRIEFPK